MTDTCILVPMLLDVMVLTPVTDLTTPFLREQMLMSYEALQLFQNPEPAPFPGGSTVQPDAGAYLHWTLPQALRHGTQHDDGTTTFPYVPNRWLIARVQHGVPANQAIKAWIIQSDYYDPSNQNPGTSPYLDPSGLQNGFPTPTTIGQVGLLSTVTTLPSQPSPFLQAIGPGAVYFSAFEPGVQNVLAFFDNMTMNDDKTPIGQAATFTYYLVGWYSDPPIDPLHGTKWKANADPDLPGTYLNCTLPWYVYANSADLPTQTVVHAMVSSVTWDPTGNNGPPPNYPVNIPTTVQVAVGNTAIDALSAIVGYNRNQTEADMLSAFQYNLLDQFNQPGSSEALNMAIREHWFGGLPGGTLWTIAAVEPPGSTALPIPDAPPLTPDQANALAALNVAQRALDQQQRILASMQWTLSGLWWMYQWQNQNNPPQPAPGTWLSRQLPRQIGIGTTPVHPGGTDPSQEPWYAWKVKAQQNLIAQLTDAVNTATTNVSNVLDAALTLKGTNAPQFFAPQDPVLLITGLGRATNFDPSEGILCRLPSQTITSLTYNNTPYTASSLAARVPVLADPHGLLPAGSQELNVENLLLSAGLFAQDVLGDATQQAAVQKAIDALLQAPPAGGQVPPISYSVAPWVQPWVPLMLDWQVTVLKAPAYVTPLPWSIPDWNPVPISIFDASNWQFNGTDFVWIGPTQAQGQASPPDTFSNFDESDSASMQIAGRTFITPQATFTLAGQLDKYVNTHAFRDPDLEKMLQDLDATIDTIAGQDILSQRLSGLLGRIIQRGAVPSIIPSGPITDLLGNTEHGVPVPFPSRYASYGGPAWDFAPLAGTYFVIDALTVIDAFGRTIDIMLSNYSTAPPTGVGEEDYFFPIAAPGVRSPTGQNPAPNKPSSTDPTTRMLKLPPRAIQGSRLSFTLLSNDGTDTDITLKGDANPVCGWVVPNHLDRSLAMYAPDGTAWGELYLSQHVNNAFFPAWQPDPTNGSAPQSVADIPNQFVKGMLNALWTRQDNGTALSDLLLAIDQGLWTINPPGDRNDLDLDVLVGRPLAIVRAEVSLGLNGLPVTSQDWWNVFATDPTHPTGNGSQPVPLANIDGGVSSYLWGIRLGSQALRDDGLIGYFADNPAAPTNTYNLFSVVNLPADLQTDYLQQIGQANYPQLRFVDDSVTTLDPTKQQVVRLTMLVDPRGSVHAFSGLLPVVTVPIPSQFVTPALKNIYYTFRAGPLLTTPDAVRVPRPAASQGTWGWFDYVLAQVTALTPADANSTIPTTAPLVKEGWLKFTPNPPPDQQKS